MTKDWTPHAIAGPWVYEPNSFQWKDKTGLPCFAVRTALGTWCGYVGVGIDHPLYSSECPLDAINVHGGITFAGYPFWEEYRPVDMVEKIARRLGVQTRWFIGFDCAHAHDVIPRMESARPTGLRTRRRDSSVYFLYGLPSGLRRTYKTLDYVKRECAKLARQLAAMEN